MFEKTKFYDAWKTARELDQIGASVRITGVEIQTDPDLNLQDTPVVSSESQEVIEAAATELLQHSVCFTDILQKIQWDAEREANEELVKKQDRLDEITGD